MGHDRFPEFSVVALRSVDENEVVFVIGLSKHLTGITSHEGDVLPSLEVLLRVVRIKRVDLYRRDLRRIRISGSPLRKVGSRITDRSADLEYVLRFFHLQNDTDQSLRVFQDYGDVSFFADPAKLRQVF